MNSKWYFSSFFLILFVCFGAFQDKGVTPNQEIVLEFVDNATKQKNIEHTIADIKHKLQEFGVSNILIKETKNNTLKIAYHSIVPVDEIKETLEKETSLILNNTPKNKEKNKTSSDYNIAVYELTQSTDIDDIEDKFVFEMKNHSDRFTHNSSSVFLKHSIQEKANLNYKNAYQAFKKNPFTKDRLSCEPPQVRAGPQHSVV